MEQIYKRGHFFSLLKYPALLGVFSDSGTEQVLLCAFTDSASCCSVYVPSMNECTGECTPEVRSYEARSHFCYLHRLEAGTVQITLCSCINTLQSLLALSKSSCSEASERAGRYGSSPDLLIMLLQKMQKIGLGAPRDWRKPQQRWV